MALIKISALNVLAGVDTASDDVFNIVDTSAVESKQISRDELAVALSGSFASASQGSLADSALQPGDDAADLGSAAATDGYVLTADGAGGAAWEVAASGGISDVVADTTPQLGGTLDLNGHPISGSVGTLTTDIKALDLSVTWNNAAVTFTGWKFNVTDTASGANSLLLDMQLGGSSKFWVTKAGNIYAGAQTYIDNASGFFANNARGFQNIGTGTGSFGWASDTYLWRDSAGAAAQRNGTNAQTSRLYNTYTDASNYERLAIGWSANVVSIKTENAGTGATRYLHISGLPTSNPGPGILWNNAGTPAIGT